MLLEKKFMINEGGRIMHNIKRKIMGSLMAVLMGTSTILGTCPAPIFATSASTVEVDSEATQVNANDYGLVSANEGNILHAWNWSLKNIKAQLPEIAAAGYSIVQTSPLQVSDYQDKKSAPDNKGWWKAYQPYDYAYGSVYGSEEEFKELCAEAKKYGISIIVDVVANHMASTRENNVFVLKEGVNDFWKNNQGTYFHNNDNRAFGTQYDRPNNDTKDGKPCYNSDKDRYATVFFNIGVKDVNTENADVQARMLKYLEQLVADGAGGFRFDAIKHIGTSTEDNTGEGTKSDFWVNTVKKVQKENPELLIYGETLNTVAVSTSKYVADGLKITESQKGWNLKDILRNKTITSQSDMFTYARSSEGVSNDNIIDWVENHDTYLNYWGCTGLESAANYMDDKQIMLGWSALASREGTQSLFFSRPDGCHLPENANPSNDDTNKIDGDIATLTSNKTWKDAKVAAVNKFKNAMIGEKEDCSVKGNAAIIKRGNKGVVVTNFSDSEATVEVSGLTGLADGTYEDASGQNGTITVSGGKASIKVKGTSFVVLYDAKATPVSTAAPEATTVAATEAPSETASITVDKKDGSTFTEAMTVKVTASNAEKAYYSYDGADWKEFTGSASVTVGKEELVAGDQVGLYVAAFGKDGKLVKESCVYTKASKGSTGSSTTTAGENTIIAKLPSGWANMYIYAYGDAKEYTGKWPGNTMTKGSDGNYTYTLSGVDGSAKVIFNDGNNNQDPAAQQPGHTFEAGKAYSYADGKFTPVEVATATAEPATGTKKAVEPKEWPTYEVENENVPSVKVDQKSGTSFDEETLDVTITVKNADSAYYTIDGGVQKSFKDSATVAVGQGKIADTEVTLQVVATKGTEKTTETYTYKKVFNQAKAAKKQTVKTAAFTRIQSIMDVVAEAAQVNAATLSNEALAVEYQTNTVGIGKKKTISVDKAIDDWDESMLIARGNANDDPRVYRPNSMYEVPVDEYALYGAYDDSNLYLMWEMTNVQDVVAPDDNFPLVQGTMCLNMNVPFFIAIDTGNSDTIGNECKTAKGETIWNSGISIKQNLNRLIAISTNGANGPFVYSGDSSGINPVEIFNKAGDTKSKIEKSGIQFGYGQGILSKKVIGIDGGYGKNHNRVVGDVCDDSADRVDFNTKGHNSDTMDYHYEIAIPYAELGISASDVESKGVGVMVIATMGKSGMDCLPYDVTMNDQADKDDTAGSQENNSFEKSDEDVITAGFARIGKGEIQEVKKPSTTRKPTVTTAPTTTASADATTAPTSTSTTQTAAPTSDSAVISEPTDQFVVNFGADKAAPQAAGSNLTLKAIPYNADGECTYEFSVDGEVVQEYSDSDTYNWTAATGTQKIAVSVKDAKGNVVTVEKDYTTEGEAPEVTTAPTNAPTATPAAQKNDISVSLVFSKKNKCAVNTKISIRPVVNDYVDSYTYTITARKINGSTKVITRNSSSKSVSWKPTATGKYELFVTVIDKNNNVATASYSYKVTLISLKLKASAKTVKLGKKVKITAKASNINGKAKYQYVIKKGSKKIKTVKYSSKKAYTWTVSKKLKKGTYSVIVSVKDNSKKVVKKTVKIKVKK